MTLLGELYANGEGVNRDDQKAVDLVQERRRPRRPRGDAGARDDDDGRARHAEGSRDRGQAAGVFRQARQSARGLQSRAALHRGPGVSAGSEARRRAVAAGGGSRQPGGPICAGDVLQGRPRHATRIRPRRRAGSKAASQADYLDAEVEYAIALFNGTGIDKDQAAAVALLQKAARQGSPIAQNRLARVLATGVGAPKDLVEALKWHLISKQNGASDPELDAMLAPMSAESKQKAQAEVNHWFTGK